MASEVLQPTDLSRYYRRRRALKAAAAASVALLAGSLGGALNGKANADRIGSGEPLVGFLLDARTPDHQTVDIELDLVQQTGADAVDFIATWGATQAEAKNDVPFLQYAVNKAKDLGLEPFITYAPCWDKNNPRCHPPLTAGELQRSRSTIAYLAHSLDVKNWIIGIEPNSGTFWQAQFYKDGSMRSPTSYANFLASSYDEIKKVSSDNQVICGNLASVGKNNPSESDPRHQSISPTYFIDGLGKAFKAMGRSTKFCDLWGQHPYGETPTDDPATPHTDGTIGWADQDQQIQRKSLTSAFAGTAQIFSGVANTEYGVDTQSADGSPRVTEAKQGQFYKYAIGKGACRHQITLLLGAQDEPDQSRWQAGVFTTNGVPKGSLVATQEAIKNFENNNSGGISC